MTLEDLALHAPDDARAVVLLSTQLGAMIAGVTTSEPWWMIPTWAAAAAVGLAAIEVARRLARRVRVFR